MTEFDAPRPLQADAAAMEPIKASDRRLSWFDIFRLGLVQMALGGVIVLGASLFNRVMEVEFALAATFVGILFGVKHGAQAFRARWGHGLDKGGRRSWWIIGGMAALGLGASISAIGVAQLGTTFAAGYALTLLGYLTMGLGGGAAGTTVLAFLAQRTAPERRAAAASITWIMMIAGIVISSASASAWLEPFSLERMVWVASAIGGIAFLIACVAVLGLERRFGPPPPETRTETPFLEALREVWDEPQTRLFTVFIFISMIAFNLQELILEPFGGHVFDRTPGETAMLTSIQHQGVLLGMILVPLIGWLRGGQTAAALRSWTIFGCIASAGALSGLAVGGIFGAGWPLEGNVFLLGLFNGIYAVGAIGSMMALAGDGPPNRVGVRMGLWGAAQGIAFGGGAVMGAVALDIAAAALGARDGAYSIVFAAEAGVFLIAAVYAARCGAAAVAAGDRQAARRYQTPVAAEPIPAE